LKISPLHSWNLKYDEARELQRNLAPQLKLKWENREIHTIAGCDVSGEFRGRKFFAAVVVMSYPKMDVIEKALTEGEADFPYVPGLLSFREMPVLLKTFEKLETLPDVVFCDGSGTIHPRKFGLACHLGLWLNLPVIGVAKNLLCGEYSDLKKDKGAWSPVLLNRESVGAALRSKNGVKPIFTSPGNHISPEKALELTLNTCRYYRLPEPIRAAHKAANDFRRLVL